MATEKKAAMANGHDVDALEGLLRKAVLLHEIECADFISAYLAHRQGNTLQTAVRMTLADWDMV